MSTKIVKIFGDEPVLNISIGTRSEMQTNEFIDSFSTAEWLDNQLKFKLSSFTVSHNDYGDANEETCLYVQYTGKFGRDTYSSSGAILSIFKSLDEEDYQCFLTMACGDFSEDEIVGKLTAVFDDIIVNNPNLIPVDSLVFAETNDVTEENKEITTSVFASA